LISEKSLIEVRHKTREKRYVSEIPAPTGPEWIAIDKLRLWLPSNKRKALSHAPRLSDLHIETRGAGWAVARSALDFLRSLLKRVGKIN